MIDFARDVIENDSGVPPHATRIVGVGRAGVEIIDSLQLQTIRNKAAFDLTAIDTHEQVIKATVAEKKHLLTAPDVQGLGCSGDIERGLSVVRINEPFLRQWIQETETVILVAGLAGGTGGGVTAGLVALARKHNVKTIVIGVLPHTVEGQKAKDRAQKVLDFLREQADCVLAIPSAALDINVKLKQTLEQVFYAFDKELARSVEAIERLLRPHALTPRDFSDLRSLFGKLQGTVAYENCWVGSVERRKDEHGFYNEDEVAAALFERPLLGDRDIFKKVQQGLLCITFGGDYPFSQQNDLIKHIQEKMPQGFALAIQMAHDAKLPEELRISLFLAKTEAAAKKKSTTITKAVPENESQKAVAAKPQKAAEDLNSNEKTPEIEKPVPAQEKIATPRGARAGKSKPATPSMLELEPIKEETFLSAVIAPHTPELSSEMVLPLQRGHRLEQLELANDALAAGGRSFDTYYKNENLDIPTYVRRKIPLEFTP
jgi:cell division protein FtsZ